jgi:hypothetical protein
MTAPFAVHVPINIVARLPNPTGISTGACPTRGCRGNVKVRSNLCGPVTRTRNPPFEGLLRFTLHGHSPRYRSGLTPGVAFKPPFSGSVHALKSPVETRTGVRACIRARVRLARVAPVTAIDRVTKDDWHLDVVIFRLPPEPESHYPRLRFRECSRHRTASGLG